MSDIAREHETESDAPQATVTSGRYRHSTRQRRRDHARARARGVGQKHTLRTVGLFLAAVAIAVGAYATYTYATIANRIALPKEDLADVKAALDAPATSPATQTAAAPVVPEDPPVHILLMGNDRRPGQGWGRSDSIMIARFDPPTGNISLLSFPRDSYVSVRGHGNTKLTHAAAYGGPALAVKTVRELTGLPIHHYIQVDFDGFAAIVDALGGVRINVDRGTVSPEGYAIRAGDQVLTGRGALTFARNRKGYGDGDFARIRNQQIVLKALVKKLSKRKNITRIPKVVDAASFHVQTDLKVKQIIKLAKQYRAGEERRVFAKTAPRTTGTVRGGSYVLLDRKKLRKMVRDFEDGGFGDRKLSRKWVPRQVLSE